MSEGGGRMDGYAFRRTDRQVTDIGEILEIAGKCRVIRLAMTDSDGRLYIVPMNYGYEYAGGVLSIYLHSAKSGRKLDIIKSNPNIAFELDCDNGVSCGELPCSATCYYESITGTGRAELLEAAEEKARALELLMRNVTGRVFTFDEEAVNSVAVIKVTADSFTCKRHKGRGQIR